MAKASRWLKLFEEFTKDVRIKSKEETTKDDRGVPFVLWESQKRAMRYLAEGLDDDIRIFYFLKSRQLGITTLTLLIDVFWMATHKHLDMALVTENEANRDKNRGLIRHYIGSFPPGYFGDDFYIRKGQDNNKMMGFSNGSSMRFLIAGTKKKSIAWGEGSGFPAAHLTEVASFYGSDGLASFEESFSRSNPDRLYIYESTAKGMAGAWHDRWKLAQEDRLTRRGHFIGWWANPHNTFSKNHPVYADVGRLPRTKEEREMVETVAKLYDYEITPEQLCWYRYAYQSAKGEEKMLFFQNNPSTAREAFVESGYSFFPVRKITKLVNQMREDETREFEFQCYRYDYGDDFFDLKLEYLDPANYDDKFSNVEPLVELKVWEEPKTDAKYVLGMDPSFATDHGDFTVVSVWRVYADCMVQVAEYATNKVEPVRTAWVLAHLSGAYRDCVVNLELDGGGANVMQELDSLRSRLKSDLYAEHVRSQEWDDALGWARWYLYHRPDSMGAGYMYNTKASYSHKQQMMFGFNGCFATGQLIIRSERLLFDMVNVRVDGNTIGAPDSSSEDCKDDRVIAGALACKAWLDHRRSEMIALGLTREIAARQEEENPRAVQNMVKRRVNNLVYRFVQTEQQRIQEEAMNPVPTWREERGL